MGSYGVPFALGAPGPLGPCLSVSRGVFLLARGPGDGPDVVLLHGCRDAQSRALVPLPV